MRYLISGWATDCRLLSEFMNIDGQAMAKDPYDPKQIISVLKAKAEEEGPLSLVGFSMGGFLAIDFASQYPDLVDEVVAISIRNQYKASEIKMVKRFVEKNKEGYLKQFYRNCILSSEKQLDFEKNYLEDLLCLFSTEHLIKTLDDLAELQVTREKLEKINKITIKHGTNDRIAPVKEVRLLVAGLENVNYVEVEGSGHIL